MVGFITSGTVISFGSGPITVAALRRQLPDQERPFKLPLGDVFPFIGFLAANLIVYWTGWDTNWKLFLAVLIGYILMFVYYRFGGRVANSVEDKWSIPPLQLKSGWWMILWIAGLTVLSLLSIYGDGSLSLLPFGWGELVVFIFSIVVFAIGIRTRLSPQEVVTNVENTREDEVESQEA